MPSPRGSCPDPNLAIRTQAEAISVLHRRLYPWADRIRSLVGEHARIDVPPIVIGMARLRRSVMGYYVVGRDALRLRGSVMLNTVYLQLPLCWVLEVLVHEVLHFAEELSGEMSHATRSSYHTAWFRKAAAELGIPCTRDGISTGNELNPDLPFGRLLAHHGVALVPLASGEEDARVSGGSARGRGLSLPPPRTTQVRFACGCTIVRGPRRVQARCLACGRRFVAEPSRAAGRSRQSER